MSDFVGNIIYFSLFILIVAPEISQSPRDATEVEGQTAEFNCVVAGYPKPDVAWEKNGVELNVAEHTRLRVSSNDGNHQLIISNVQQSDAGQYKCVANNSLDTVTSSSATLTVHCKSNSSFSVKRASVEYSFIWFVGWFFFFKVLSISNLGYYFYKPYKSLWFANLLWICLYLLSCLI